MIFRHGCPEIESRFAELIAKYPETLKCIPLLLAVRANEISVLDNTGEYHYQFAKQNYSTEQYCQFMRETGLFDSIQDLEQNILQKLA